MGKRRLEEPDESDLPLEGQLALLQARTRRTKALGTGGTVEKGSPLRWVLGLVPGPTRTVPVNVGYMLAFLWFGIGSQWWSQLAKAP